MVVASLPDKVRVWNLKTEKIEKQHTAMTVDQKLTDSPLPEASKTKLRESFKDKVADDDEISTAISAEQKYLASLTGDGFIVPGRFIESTDVKVIAEQSDKFEAAMDGFFENEDQEIGEGDK